MPLVPVFSKKKFKQPSALSTPKVSTFSNLIIKEADGSLSNTNTDEHTTKSAKAKGNSKPFRSLSDAEYEDIFAAVLTNVSHSLSDVEANFLDNKKSKNLDGDFLSVEDFECPTNEAIFKEIDESQVVPGGEVDLFPLENIVEGYNEQQDAPVLHEDNPFELPPPPVQQLQTPEISDDDAHATDPPKLKKKKKKTKQRKGIKRKHLNFFDEQLEKSQSQPASQSIGVYDYGSDNDAEVPGDDNRCFWQEKARGIDLDETSTFTRSTSSKVMLGRDNIVPSSADSAASTAVFSTPKKAVTCKRKKQRISQKDYILKQQQQRNIGTWVECSICHKWRYLKEVTDPVEVPRFWTCSMNTDKQYNSCEKLQEVWSEDVDKRTIFNSFTAGSVVWAKVDGFPWWPALVDDDPDTEDFFFTDENSVPTHYNVVFFGEKVSRSWISVSCIQPFKSNNVEAFKSRIYGSKSYTEELNTAKQQALSSLQMTIKDRLKKFGFATRYDGKWPQHYSSSEEENKNDLRSPVRSQLKKNTAKKNHKQNSNKPVGKQKREKLAQDECSRELKENVEPSFQKTCIRKHSGESDKLQGAPGQALATKRVTPSKKLLPLHTEISSKVRGELVLQENKYRCDKQTICSTYKKPNGLTPPLVHKGKTVPQFGKKRSATVVNGGKARKVLENECQYKSCSKGNYNLKYRESCNKTCSEKETHQQLNPCVLKSHNKSKANKGIIESVMLCSDAKNTDFGSEISEQSMSVLETRIQSDSHHGLCCNKQVFDGEANKRGEANKISFVSNSLEKIPSMRIESSSNNDFVPKCDHVPSSIELPAKKDVIMVSTDTNNVPMPICTNTPQFSEQPAVSKYSVQENSDNGSLVRPDLSSEADCNHETETHLDTASLHVLESKTETDSQRNSGTPVISSKANEPSLINVENYCNVNSEGIDNACDTRCSTPNMFELEMIPHIENAAESRNLNPCVNNSSNKDDFSPAFVEYSANSSPHSPAFDAEPMSTQSDRQTSVGCNVPLLDLEE